MIADLEANPGSKAGEVASRVGMNPNHAQTILGNLVKQGVATKEGQQYTVASPARVRLRFRRRKQVLPVGLTKPKETQDVSDDQG